MSAEEYVNKTKQKIKAAKIVYDVKMRLTGIDASTCPLCSCKILRTALDDQFWRCSNMSCKYFFR